ELVWAWVADILFFQAEDGIRDFHVTGVQTCALPISSVRPRAPPNAVPFHTRPVTSWNGRVLISWPAPATPMITETPQPRWQHSSAWRMRLTLPTHSKL